MSELIKPNPLNKSLVSALRRARRNMGLSQVQLAEEMGINLVTVAKIELGQTIPSLNLYNRMFEHLGVEIDVRLK